MSNPLIFSGESNPKLAEFASYASGATNGTIYHHRFPSGEYYAQFKENLRGEDVYLVQTAGGNGMDSNNALMQLLIMIDAARRASAGRITAVIPQFFYQRQERKDKPRVPISAKLTMNILEAAGANRLLTMDLHAAQIQGFTDLPIDHLYFQPVLLNYIGKKYLPTSTAYRNLVFVAPDVGGVKRATEYATKVNCDFALIAKRRKNDIDVEIESFVGDVNDKIAIIVDDLTESCGTIIQAAKACKSNGAKKVVAAVSHFGITDIGKQRLGKAMSPDINGVILIDEFIYSDTIADTWTGVTKPANITCLGVADLFGRAIGCIHNNKSISQLFD